MNNKYIRLKDRIAKINAEDTECYYFDNLKKFVYKDESYKVSTVLKDLCDTFVFDGGEEEPLICTYEELVYWFNHSKEQQYKTRNCYSAIWTSKGLIYVTKMNKKGIFRLI